MFGPDGLKLSDKIEKKIEKLIDSKISKNLSEPKVLGRVKRLEDANDKYIKILKNNFPKSFKLKKILNFEVFFQKFPHQNLLPGYVSNPNTLSVKIISKKILEPF